MTNEQKLLPCPISERIKMLSAAHGGLRGLSRALGIDAGYLSRLANGEKQEPSTEILSKLGLRKVVRYEDTLGMDAAEQPQAVDDDYMAPGMVESVVNAQLVDTVGVALAALKPQVAEGLPERREYDVGMKTSFGDGWNACLDACAATFQAVAAERDALRAEVEQLHRDQERLDAIEANYENLRAAIDQAMKADAYPPARPEYPEIDAALGEDNWNMSPCKQGHRDVGVCQGKAFCHICDETIIAATTQEAFEQWNASHPAIPQ
ncbi:hypothetical protein [Pseudomonas typographi]|uniref:hypothetical protein n=1 Tax=Pseudomonas typographi TaxID=2715964 RepID=UPI001683CBBC|nr:hypothetical protein [Pseudomonas typographi]MBD1554254.1 helix-turn-helix transcriptional regulator [Pseudomonas typographi]